MQNNMQEQLIILKSRAFDMRDQIDALSAQLKDREDVLGKLVAAAGVQPDAEGVVSLDELVKVVTEAFAKPTAEDDTPEAE